MKKKTSSQLNSPLVLVLVLAVLIGVGIYAYQKFTNKEFADKQTGKTDGLSRTEMLSRGIHPDPVDIKVLEGTITAQWQDNSVAYTLEKAYLTPDIADLGSARNNADIKDKSFLIVQLNARDRRTSGDRRSIQEGNYLRIRQDKKDSAPLGGDYLYLSPQENGTTYVIFPVARNLNKFTLLAGLLSRPRVIQLDFGSNNVKILNGVFIYRGGYFPEYSPDLHP